MFVNFNKYIGSNWPSFLPQWPDPTVLENIWIEPLEVVLSDEAKLTTRLLFDTELEIKIPGLDIISLLLAPGGGGTIVSVEVQLTPNFQIRLKDIPVTLRLSTNLLQPVVRVPSDDSGSTYTYEVDSTKQYVEITIGELTLILNSEGINIESEISIDLPLCMIGETGVIITAEDIKIDLSTSTSPDEILAMDGYDESFRGIYIGSGEIIFSFLSTGEGDNYQPLTLELENAVIGNEGFTGQVSVFNLNQEFNLFSEANKIILKDININFIENIPELFSITGTLNLEFLEEPLTIELIWEDGGIIIRCPDTLEFEIGETGFIILAEDIIIDFSSTSSPQPILDVDGFDASFQGVFIKRGMVTIPFISDDTGQPIPIEFANLGVGNQGFQGEITFDPIIEFDSGGFTDRCLKCSIITDAFEAALDSVTIGFENGTLSIIAIEGALWFDFCDVIVSISVNLEPESGDFIVKFGAFGADEMIYIYGTQNETHLAFKEVEFNYKPGEGFDLDVKDLDLLIKPGDNPLLNEILPPEGIPANFDLPLRYEGGDLSIRGGLDIEIIIPINKVIGPITLQTIALGFESDGEEKAITIGASFGAAIGPIAASVKNLGLRLPFKMPGDNGKQVSIETPEIKFPDGIGLGIDSDMIKGGGYIERDGDQYSGILELSLSTWGVSAIAVIDTAPDFSLLCAIFAELNIQIGMGFVLQKVGGLIGIHRTIAHEEIAPKIQSGILDDILFPTDVIKNAAQIIQNYNLSFPVQRNQFLFGPAIQIGYGAPPLISVSLAVLFEFPSPYSITIMGKVNAEIPPLAPLVELNLGILGEINLTEEYAAIYGTLYDSKILTFPLSGDMGCLFSWGSDSQFLFSIGGFHPRFTPPPDFPPFGAPPLKRLQLALSKYVVCEVYLAITTNTFQAGARVDAKFEGAGAELSGYLGFDTLIQFSPFYFIVDVGAGFAVKFKGYTLLSVDLSGTLEGPNPYKIKGKASFSILFWDINVNVNLKFGKKKPESIEKFDPWELLYPALMEGDPWESEIPGWADLVVIIKKEDPALQATGQTSPPPPLVHPIGNLKYYQKAVPIKQTLEWVITGEPKNYSKFEFDVVEDQSHGLIKGEPVKELFAPAHWTKMSQTEKLNAPSTDEHDAGIYVTSNEIKFESITHKTVVYETKMIGMPEGKLARLFLIKIALYIPTLMECNVFEMGSAAYFNNLQNNNHNQYCYDHIPVAATVMEEKFIIIDENFNRVNLNLVDNEELNEEYNHTSATNILKEYKANNPQDERVLQVISLFELEGGML